MALAVSIVGRPGISEMTWLSPKLMLREIDAAGRNFHSIDFFRGIAALCVVIFHFKNFAQAGGTMSLAPSVLDRVVLLHWLEPIRLHGSFAVMAFWAISGFVFANVYAGKRPDGFPFFIRRFARLYPLHAVTLLVIALLQIVAIGMLGHALIFQENSLQNFVLNIFFATDWGLEQGRSFNFPIWSVSAEVLIYALFWVMARFLKLNLLVLAGIWLVLEILAAATHAQGILLCGVYFFGGTIIYSIYRLWDANRLRTLMMLSAAIFVASLIVGKLGEAANIPTTFWLLPTIGAILLMLVCAEDLWFGHFFKKTKPVGDITYSSYLWHSPIQVTILLGAGLGFWSLESLFTDVFFVSYLILVCLVSTASFRWIERPAQRWVLARFDPSYRRKPLISAP
jgi:peptidoglycan/LPS O-acetylase OafA/YrhL